MATSFIGIYLNFIIDKNLPLRIVKVDMKKALKLSCHYDIYAYDAYYLETSFRLKLPLLTLDGPMKKHGKNMKIDILEVKK
jgi:predicted nucleic acid-binding protein